mmetsp:Transcript_6965/g.26323  ORF Transcript_6965/g.26323 Transcript_6965/m.26323 type:complete len:248 (+) Transcript_6965:1923-2666(+)
MSSATFLFMKLVFKTSNTGERSSRSNEVLPTTFRTRLCLSKLAKKVFFVAFLELVVCATDSDSSSPDPSLNSSSLNSTSSSESTRDGFVMSTFATSVVSGGLPSLKSRPSVLPLAFSPAHTRFSLVFLSLVFSSFVFSLLSGVSFPTKFPLLLLDMPFPPPFFDFSFREAFILERSNASEESLLVILVALSASKSDSTIFAFPEASFFFSANARLSNALGSVFGALLNAAAASSFFNIFVKTTSNSG